MQEKSGDEERYVVAQTVSNWNQNIAWLQEIELLRREGWFVSALVWLVNGSDYRYNAGKRKDVGANDTSGRRQNASTGVDRKGQHVP